MKKGNFARVKDHEYLIKDMETGAILNTDHTAILKHQKRVNEIEKDKRRDQEIDSIKSELSEIKELIKILIKKD